MRYVSLDAYWRRSTIWRHRPVAWFQAQMTLLTTTGRRHLVEISSFWDIALIRRR